MNDKDFEELLKSISEGRWAKEEEGQILNLKRLALTKEQLEIIFEKVKSRALFSRKMDLSENGIVDLQVDAVSEFIKSPHFILNDLRTLDLSSNRIGISGLRNLAKALQSNDYLVELNVDNNPAFLTDAKEANAIKIRIDRKLLLNAAHRGDVDRVQKYIESGGNPNTRDDNERNLLVRCMEGFDPHNLSLYLLKKGFRLTQRVDDIDAFYSNLSEVHWAYFNGRMDTFKFLLEQRDIDLTASCDAGNEERCPQESTNENGCYALEEATVLHFATDKGDIQTVKMLCGTKRININACANVVFNKDLLDYDTFFSYEASYEWNKEVISQNPPLKDGIERLGYAYIHDASYRIERIFKVTALHLAAMASNDKLIAYLISQGADPNLQDSRGQTAKDYYKHAKKVNELNKLFASVGLKEKPCRRRLLIGEADLSYTKAVLAKHLARKPGLPASMTATEYKSYDEMKKSHGANFEKTVTDLKALGVTVMFGVDGKKIHQHPELMQNRYKRIHFNFPHDKSSYKSRTLPPIIAGFFQSASQLQNENDEIHMALPHTPLTAKKPDGSKKADWKFYQGYTYGIFEASARAGYVLIKKREFQKSDDKRYPEYLHTQTGVQQSALASENSREFIFKKTTLTYEQIRAHKNYGPGGTFEVYRENVSHLQDMETDDDSSSYEDSDEEMEHETSSFTQTMRPSLAEQLMSVGGSPVFTSSTAMEMKRSHSTKASASVARDGEVKIKSQHKKP